MNLQGQLAPANGFRDSLGARGRVQFVKHCGQVELHRVGRDSQGAGNPLVRCTARDQRQDLALATRQRPAIATRFQSVGLSTGRGATVKGLTGKAGAYGVLTFSSARAASRPAAEPLSIRRKQQRARTGLQHDEARIDSCQRGRKRRCGNVGLKSGSRAHCQRFSFRLESTRFEQHQGKRSSVYGDA